MTPDPAGPPPGTDVEHASEIQAYRDQIDELSAELAETNRGVVALSLEVEEYREHLEDLVAQRTSQLEATQEELQQTNSELLMLTSELDSRIALRTAELTEANAALTHQIAEVDRARELVRRVNERLELATESAGLGIWEWDVTDDVLVWDDTTFRLYGEQPDRVADTARIRRERLWGTSRRDCDLRVDSPLLAEPRFTTEFEIRWPDGSRHVLSSSGLVVRGDDGSPVAVVGVDQDITDRVVASEELERYQSQLEDLVTERTAQLRDATERANAANIAKSAFLANMSHELRTPMNAILGFANLLRTGEPTPGQREEYLEIISRSGTHLLALINDILDMSKIESGRIELELGPVAVRPLVKEVVDLMRDPASQKGLAIASEVADDVPEVISADEVKLRQILLNLLSNAIKNTASGAVRLGARLLVESAGDDPVLSLEVADTGVGISVEDSERIFEPFQQVGGSTGGTGLGLSISRRFARLMGGDLTVASTPGEGSVFEVRVPGRPSDEAPAESTTGHRRVIGLTDDQVVRVLVVEDQPESALLLRTLMEEAGIAAVVAADGQAGVDAFVRERPDLIWMDGRMPVMDGLEATRRIRQLEGGDAVVIIGVTASVFTDERDTLTEAGMDDVVTKPYEAHEIFARMQQHLGVRFRYEDETLSAVPVDSVQLTPDRLAQLPADVRDALADALVLLDATRIAAAIERATLVDEALGADLAVLAAALRYETMLSALDAVGDE